MTHYPTTAPPAPGTRTSVRVSDEMSDDLAALLWAGFTVSDALREGVRVLAEMHRNAWAAGVPGGVPVVVMSATAEPVSDARMTPV
jgi:hypothetical protein